MSSFLDLANVAGWFSGSPFWRVAGSFLGRLPFAGQNSSMGMDQAVDSDAPVHSDETDGEHSCFEEGDAVIVSSVRDGGLRRGTVTRVGDRIRSTVTWSS